METFLLIVCETKKKLLIITINEYPFDLNSCHIKAFIRSTIKSVFEFYNYFKTQISNIWIVCLDINMQNYAMIISEYNISIINVHWPILKGFIGSRRNYFALPFRVIFTYTSKNQRNVICFMSQWIFSKECLK